MAAEEACRHIDAHEMLLEATENVFYNQSQVVINLLDSNRELFSQEVLNKSVLSCCRNGILLLLPAIISAGANLEVTDENGNTPLLVCALNRHESCARILIGAGADVNAANLVGNTSLIVSVLNYGSIEMTKLLVENNNVSIDHTNNDGYTALFYAIETANLNAIKLLIDAGASAEINDVFHETSFDLDILESRKRLLDLINLFTLETVTGRSSLLQAALDRDLESAQTITSMDESIVNTTNDSLAIIMIEFLKSIQDNNNVVNQPEMEMFEFLLAQLNPNLLSSSEKEMIIDIAIFIGDLVIVERLSKYDFVISIQHLSTAVSKPDLLHFLLTKRQVINKLDHNNQPVYDGSPLHEAMIENEIESAKTLIQNGAFMDVDQALEDAVKWNLVEALEFLLSEFPDQVGQKLQSPKLLHDAVKNSALNIIPVMLDKDADINAEYNGKYCLTQAVDVNVLELLLSRGADPNIKIGSNPYTYPLHTFLSREFEDSIRKMWLTFGVWAMDSSFWASEIKDFLQCLLKHGAQVDLKDGRGETALHVASQKNHFAPVVQLLIDSGANVNQMDQYGATPLKKAVNLQDPKIVECLANSGANLNFVYTSTGKPVIFEARSQSVLKILIDNGADVKSTNGESPLTSLLAERNIGTENVKRLINAGCCVNHVNKDGETAIIHAAKYVDIKLLELLVQEGADVNTSGRKFPYKTAIKALLPNLWYERERVMSCINYLIDQNASIDKVKSSAIHAFITSRCLSLIPRFISHGLAPAYLSVKMSASSGLRFKRKFSPLMMAILLNQLDLAGYFFNIKYLMKSDIAFLNRNEDSRLFIQESSYLNKLYNLPMTVGLSPLSLATLCFVVISDALGPTQDRKSKVQKLGLPRPMQDSLLFKKASQNDIKDVGETNIVFFRKSLEQSNVYLEPEDRNRLYNFG